MPEYEKDLKEKTYTQLKEEYYYWDNKIKNAPEWGAAVNAALEFREDVLNELHKRGLSL